MTNKNQTRPSRWARTLRRFTYLFSLFIACMLWTTGAMAQLAIKYNLTKTAGSYTSISGTGTAVTGAQGDDVATNIGGLAGFTVNGVTYTNARMGSNGWIILYNTTAPTTTTNYSPLSTASGGGTSTVVLAPFGRDLNINNFAGTAWRQQIGNELIFEWKDYNRYSTSSEKLNFQVRLNTVTGAISFVYGTIIPGSSSLYPQVGWKTTGTTASNWSTDINNLMLNVTGSPASCNWSDAVTGNANTSTVYINSANAGVIPASGLTFTWTPQSNPDPVRTFAAVSGITATQATLNWTAPSGATQYNISYRVVGSCSWTTWSGNPAMSNTATLTGLTAGTYYQYMVQASDGVNNSIYSHIPNAAGSGSGYSATGSFQTLVTCQAPTSPTGSPTSTTTANISWTAPVPPPAVGYEYAVTTSATPPGSGTPFAGTSTSVSGLTANTTYYLHVRSDCGAGDFSSWATSAAFTTPCDPTALPWTENFDGVTIPAFPSCWKEENGDWVTTNNASSSFDADARSGTQFLRESYSATNEYMWTPGFTMTAGTTYEFKFWWAGDNYSGWTGDVFVNSAQNSSGATQLGTSFVTSGTTTTKTYVQETYTFTPGATGDYYFAIRVNATGGPWYLSFDDFEVSQLIACSGTPSGGTASASINPVCSGANFNLSLTGASSGELGLTYLWESADDAAFTVNLSTVGTNETQTTSQTSDKYYRCIVTCTNSGQSATSAAVLVTTNTDACQCNTYCASNFTSATYEFVTNVTFAGINNTSAGNIGGPVDYTSFSGSVEQGGTYPLNVTIDPDLNDYVYAWIDWNGDGDFGDAGETYTLATNTSSAGPHTLNITVPCTSVLGSTRMRVMVDWNNATPNPCRSATYGEAEDYCISIGQQTLTPAGSVTSDKLNDEICAGGNINLTANGGNLGDGGTWQWYTGSCGGTNVGSGATINVSPATTTTYYVRGEVCNVATSCASITVTVKTAPPTQAVSMPFAGMPGNACPGTTANLSIPAVAGATMYTWDGPPGTTFDGNASPYTSTTPSVAIVFGTPNTSMYQIGVQAGNACGNSLRKIQKVRYSVSVPSAVNGDAVVCANTNGKVYSIPSAPEGATSYLWTITGDASINGMGNSATTSSLSVTIDFGPSWTGGTLCVAAQTSCYTSATRCKVIGTASGSFGIITGSTTACPNTNETYAVTAGTGIASYNWTVPTNTSINSGQGTNSISLNYNSSYNNVGNICVTATSICGVTSAPKCRTVAPGVAKTPTSVTGSTNGLCSALGVAYTTPIVPGVTSYNWTVTGGSIASGNGTNSISVDFGSFTTGQVCVSATNGCGTSASRCIVVKGAPNTPASITTTPSSWCANDPGILFTADVSNVTGTYTLSWAYPNTTTYVSGGGNTTSLTLDWGASNGVVMVTASNSCGNGTRTYTSNINCRESEMSANVLNVYPNPTAGMVNVEYTTEKGTAQVTVLDLSGRVVMTQTQSASEGRNTMQLDLSRVAKGAYMLNVQTQSGNNQVRIVVE